jgi:hypothetical protein
VSLFPTRFLLFYKLIVQPIRLPCRNLDRTPTISCCFDKKIGSVKKRLKIEQFSCTNNNQNSAVVVGYVGSFNVSLNQFSINSNLKPNSFSDSHQAHGKSLCQDSDSSVCLGASQTNKHTNKQTNKQTLLLKKVVISF